MVTAGGGRLARPDHGKGNHLADARRVGEQHDQPVYAQSHPSGRRHAATQGAHKVEVQRVGLLALGLLLGKV
jgi:hypothetical protein